MPLTKEQILARYDYDAQTNTLYCKKCRSVIMGKIQHQSVWIRGMCCAGTGEVVDATIPYCPKCDKKPDDRGVVYTD